LTTAGGSQTDRSPFGLTSDSKPTDSNGSVDAIASKAGAEIEARITARRGEADATDAALGPKRRVFRRFAGHRQIWRLRVAEIRPAGSAQSRRL
jgi:hypothetical protein